jgi:hypothetical protein
MRKDVFRKKKFDHLVKGTPIDCTIWSTNKKIVSEHEDIQVINSMSGRDQLHAFEVAVPQKNNNKYDENI